MSAELSFIPIESQDVNKEVNQVLDLVQESGLDFQVGIISTSVTGEKMRILKLIVDITDKMDAVCGFRFDVKLSNVCGCDL